MKIFIFIAITLAVEPLCVSTDQRSIKLDRYVPEDAKLTTPELIKKYGYPVEIHSITTSDGYILQIHRIPHGKNGPTGKGRAVLLQHGLFCSSADYLTPGPEKALGYILADAGYDVWLPNSRGNRYSRNHTHLDPDKDAKQFWNFSWHEIGIYDLPNSIDYIIGQTKEKKIYYIGQSQGTTVYYVMASEKPEYNNKISVAVSLAPIAYSKYLYSPVLRTISRLIPVLSRLLPLIGRNEFLPRTTLLSVATSSLCGNNSIFQVLCGNAMFALVGFNQKQFNATLIPIVTGHLPAGASTKQVIHYGQLHRSGRFCKFDHGKQKNLEYYGQQSPPDYNLKIVSAPMYLYYSRNDWMSSEKDVIRLVSELGNVAESILVPDNKFNHADYLFGIDAPSLIYEKIISLLARY